MDVIILCGGYGTRLKEETALIPKPMVEIGGKPLLWHIMKYYSVFGFKRFILALGYKSEYIKKYFYDVRFASSNFTIHLDPTRELTVHSLSEEKDWEVVCIDTGQKTLKGGRIKRLEPYIQSQYFHLTYGDGVSDVDLVALNKFHMEHSKMATLTAVRPPSRFGELKIQGHQVVEFSEKPQLASGFINGGFFIFNRNVLDYLTSDENCDFEFGMLQNLAQDRELMTYQHHGYWQCMDTTRDKEYLEKLWNNGQAPWKKWIS
ncbi:MAG: glucose-1-phosphate cytidylyltransferase [Deltaproteobacteria bacterium]|nr:glucose-1-phosphate cytidylyltransferase [Deltaproteobacteria bacterium]